MTESRQVRRARERAEAKGQIVVEREERDLQTFVSELLDEINAKNAERNAPRVPVSIEPDATAHPGRYPKHEDTAKGQVYGGECNVTRCRNQRAVFWNLGTYGFYCEPCANGVNWNSHITEFYMCVEVPAKPTFDEMETLRRDHGYYTTKFF